MKRFVFPLLLVLLGCTTPHFAHAALSTNLVSYWKLEDVNDSVGSNTFTNNGSVTFTAGKIGNAANFGSANTTKYLSRTDALGTTGGTMSINVWFNVTTQPVPDGASPAMFQIVEDTTSHVAVDLEIWQNAGTLRTTIGRQKLNVGQTFDTTARTFTLGTWHMMTYTYDTAVSSGQLTTYIDGVQSTQTNSVSGNGTAAASGNTTQIGKMNPFQGDCSPTNYGCFSGLVDEAGVWSRALTAAEVTTLYNAGAGCQYPFACGSTFQLWGFSITRAFGQLFTKVAIAL